MRLIHLLLCAPLSAAWLFATAAQADPLLPHQAVYSLSLTRASPAGGIAEASGDLVYDLQDGCDGWIVTAQTRIRLVYEDGSELRYGTDLKSWEAKDGQRYRFTLKSYGSYGLDSEKVGEAVLPPGGGPGDLRYSLPEPLTVPLPTGTLFPSAHTQAAIGAAEAGQSHFLAPSFDGSEDDGLLYDVSTAIGPMTAAQPAVPELQGIDSWLVALAYFQSETNSIEADYETLYHLLANGVVAEQIMNFDDFSLRARLTDFQAYEVAGC